ncbi:MAG: hypothetical protein HY823_05170 [Acidobacteria bacterium]|nr:hypothetical protein [Acidobacteriota bacterium]
MAPRPSLGHTGTVDALDLSYRALSSLAGACGRALRRGLPPGWRSRLEADPGALQGGWIWLHAVSVGEILVAEGLVRRLLEAAHRIHLTTGTEAGLALLATKGRSWDPEALGLSWSAFPFDDPLGLAPFLEVPPALFVALETELWPGLLMSLAQRGIPAVVVNGRLTERSRGPWIRSAVGRLALVAARDEASAAAFRSMGAPRVELGGNLKADLPPPPPLHEGWGPLMEAWKECRVLVAGNTVEGEESWILERFSALGPSWRMILAPRQPRRFPEAARLLGDRGIPFRRASETWPESPPGWAGTRVLLLDTLGELASAYALGTLALVGGGWGWSGGHNPLEPLRWGVPTWIGPGYSNFLDLVGPLLGQGLVEVHEEREIRTMPESVFSSFPLRGSGLGSLEPRMPPEFSGALEKTWGLLREFLPQGRYDGPRLNRGPE